MRTWTKTAGLLFLAASSVYIDQVALGGARKQASAGNDAASEPDAQLVAEKAPPIDPFAAPALEDEAPAAETIVQGKSVTKTDVNVTDAGTVEIHVNDANLVEVLRMLSLQSQRNIVASKEVRGTVTANLYDVTVREALDAILHANGYAYREKGNFIYVYTAQELAEIEQAERQRKTEVFRLHYTPAANAVTMIKPVLTADAQVAVTTPAQSGIQTGTDGIGGDSHATEDVIVVTDYADNLEAVRKVLKEIDRRPQQVMIEATILSAKLDEDNQLGVDFNLLSGVNFQSFTTDNGALTGAQAGEVAHNDSVFGGGTGNSFTSPIKGGLRLGLVMSNASVFVSALEGVTDTVVLANPKILALNKQKGEVLVGREDGYYTTTVTESTSTQTVEFLKTGTRLVFRPYIGSDGYIRMEIHPEDSTGGLNTASLPFKVTTEVTSNIMVKDGHTIVIGGLFRESSSLSRSQVPFLGNIPMAGALFRNQRDKTLREEIIVLLTPHIIKDDAMLTEAADEALKDAEKYRVGLRQGMMPWGRERLAQMEYEAALKELNRPNPDTKKALWHLNLATNNNPKMLEAIKLKEQITGREVSASDNSSIRSFVRKQVLREQELAPALPPATTELPAEEPTDPAVEQANAAATTQPVAGEAVSEDQQTTEVVVDDGAAESAPLIGLAPSTQPVLAEEVTAVPSTQPVAESTPWTTGSDDITTFVDEDTTVTPVAEMPRPTDSVDGRSVVTVVEAIEDEPLELVEPAQPELPFTVTELPIEEVSTGVDNK